MDVSEAKRLKQLEDETPQRACSRPYAGQPYIKGHNFKNRLKPAEKRKITAEIQAKYKISERRACRLSGINRSRKVETIRISASAHHAEKGKHQYKSQKDISTL